MPHFMITRGKISRDGQTLYAGEVIDITQEEASRFPHGMIEEILPFEEDVPADLLKEEAPLPQMEIPVFSNPPAPEPSEEKPQRRKKAKE